MTKGELLKRFNDAGINPDLDRWSHGIDHHPKSEKVARLLEDVDFNFFGDYFCWKFGGDGDNGETLMYELDLIFELLDYEEAKRKGLV